MKFTLEVEKYNTINYLDVKIIKTEEFNLETTAYRNAGCKIPLSIK